MNTFLSAFAPENFVLRDGFGRPAPLQSVHFHTQAEYDAYLRDSSRVPRRRPFIYLKLPYAVGSVLSLSGHAFAYRWCSLPRVRRHRAKKTQGRSERVLPWQVTMDQLICDFLSHTHYWNEVGMLGVADAWRWFHVEICLTLRGWDSGSEPHYGVSRRSQWCIRVVAVVIRQYALKNCLWQMVFGLRMGSDHDGWFFLLFL